MKQEKENILIVDDTPANIHVLGAMLQPYYEVSVAVNGEMAMESVFSESPPDLILLDVMMPEMDGYEVCKKIKEDERSKEIPVVFVTAKSEEKDEIIGFQTGAVDFIRKPVCESIALARIKMHLELKRNREILKNKADRKTKEASLSKNKLKDAEFESVRNMSFFKGLFMNSPLAIELIDTKSGTITVNKGFKNLFGLKDGEIESLEESLIIVPEDKRGDHFNMIQSAMKGTAVNYETVRIHREGYGIDVSALCYPVKHDNEIEGIFIIYEDISGRKRFEEELRHQAFHDALTGIPNRVLLMERLNMALERSRRFESFNFAVLVIDLDKFKGVNDSLGHYAGDKLLIKIASRIKSCLRSVDTVARLGGDEFAILIENVESDQEVKAIAERIEIKAGEPVNIDGIEVRTGASIGIVLETETYTSSQDIIRDADHAMYHAKECGKSRYKIFNQSMHDKAVETIAIEGELRKAISNNELFLYYQPIVSVLDGKLTGFESLVRWCHPEKGLMNPADFIPVAEENGLIIPMGIQIIKMACRQLREWKRRFPSFADITMSINISVKQFLSESFEETICDIVESHDLKPESINIELTETFLMEHSAKALTKLNILREKGFKLVIDDFGTGYSSLAYLRQFPIDHLKIDKSFISSLGDESQSTEIVKSILSLSNSLGLNVVAEGVEQKKQLDILEKLSCQNAQGFFFSKPMPERDADTFIEKYLESNEVCSGDVNI